MPNTKLSLLGALFLLSFCTLFSGCKNIEIKPPVTKVSWDLSDLEREWVISKPDTSQKGVIRWRLDYRGNDVGKIVAKIGLDGAQAYAIAGNGDVVATAETQLAENSKADVVLYLKISDLKIGSSKVRSIKISTRSPIFWK